MSDPTASELWISTWLQSRIQVIEPFLVTVEAFVYCGWCVCVDAQAGMMGIVPGMVVGSEAVLKERMPGSDLPCWFSATTWTSYSVFQSRPLSTTYSLSWGQRISGFQSDTCFWERNVERTKLKTGWPSEIVVILYRDTGHGHYKWFENDPISLTSGLVYTLKMQGQRCTCSKVDLTLMY